MKQMLYFTAPWCSPCQRLSPILDKLAQTFEIRKINIDYDVDMAQEYKIKSVPTTILFENGKEIERRVGIQPEKYYIDALSN